MWVVFKSEIRTSTSSLQPWIAQAFAINGGMSIPLIYAVNMMNKPEAVNIEFQTNMLKFVTRNFLAPFLSPLIVGPVTMSAFEKAIAHLA